MTERISRETCFSLFSELPQALTSVAAAAQEQGVSPLLLKLLEIRASQINGCAFCMDMHCGEARALGESQQRLDVLPAWREVPWFNDAECAALDWCETLTLLSQGHVSDSQFETMKQHFSEQQIIAITAEITVINSWNRVVSALGFTPERQAD